MSGATTASSSQSVQIEKLPSSICEPGKVDSAGEAVEVKDVEDIVAAQPDGKPQKQSKGKRDWRNQQPPESLSEYATNRGFLSVTDLVSLAWCEYQSLYGVLGGRSLPLDQRPLTFTTKSGTIITPDRDIAVEREKTLEKGRAIHAELEKELYAEQIVVPTATPADKWALRILEVCCGLKNLLNDGICREVRVFAIINGFLVFGQIDEIEVKRNKNSSTQQSDGSLSSPSKPNWISQDAWRKDQARQTREKKQVPLSPAEAKRMQKLDGFFSPCQSAPKGPFKTVYQGLPGRAGPSISQNLASQATTPVKKDDVWLVVSDSKTRFSPTIPRAESQTSAKLQCMLYRRMLEELCAGAEQYGANQKTLDQQTSDAAPSTPPDFEISPTFGPCDIERFLTSKDLDLQATLSDDFIAASAEWCISIGLFTKGSDTDDVIPHIRTIDALIRSLAEVVAEVRQTVTTRTICGEELGLTYRHRATFKKKKTQVSFERKGTAEKSTSSGAVEGRSPRPTQSPPMTPQRQKLRPRKSAVDVRETQQKGSIDVQKDLDEGIDERVALDLRNEQEGDVSGDIGILSSPSKHMPNRSAPTTPRKNRKDSQSPLASRQRDSDAGGAAGADATSSSPSTPYRLEQQIIAKVSFKYSASQLEQHLANVMPVWLGTRTPNGVKESETYKCNSCEYQADCEWRAEKAQEAWNRHLARKAAAEEEELWNGGETDLLDQLDIEEDATVPPGSRSPSDRMMDSEAGYWPSSGLPDSQLLERLERQHTDRVRSKATLAQDSHLVAPTEVENREPMASSEADLWKDQLGDDELEAMETH
ncbi:hypothetical protein OC845_004411 [Tilletia horrida]|nr:hypothetical protein OC845_004411 [Tilletia horrida]